MRLELITLLTLSTCQLAVACCGNKSVTSCCGNGKCNIFCCNCDGGCNKSCKTMDLPICWAWDGGEICDNPDGSTTWSGGKGKGGTKPNTRVAAEIPIPQAVNPQNVALEGGAMGDKPDPLTAKSGGGLKIERIYPNTADEDDHAMHQLVDGHGKGFFTFNEFMKYTGEAYTPELLDHFNKYDLNGDGVITPDEMRLQD